VITFKRGTDRFDMTPLTWWPVRIYGRERKTANIVCSQGHPGLITEHDIAPDGTVSPSVVCTTEGCSFHDYVKLEGWEP
jgi:hypothetical protein